MPWRRLIQYSLYLWFEKAVSRATRLRTSNQWDKKSILRSLLTGDENDDSVGGSIVVAKKAKGLTAGDEGVRAFIYCLKVFSALRCQGLILQYCSGIYSFLLHSKQPKNGNVPNNGNGNVELHHSIPWNFQKNMRKTEKLAHHTHLWPPRGN